MRVPLAPLRCVALPALSSRTSSGCLMSAVLRTLSCSPSAVGADWPQGHSSKPQQASTMAGSGALRRAPPTALKWLAVLLLLVLCVAWH